MSLASQTSPATDRHGFLKGFALSMVVVLVIVGAALFGHWRPIFETALNARLRSPDFALVGALPPAVQIHLYTALAALVLGAALMAARKGRRFHRFAGWTWVGLVAMTAGSTLFITELNHGSWSLLHLFTGWTLIILPVAVFWAKRRQVTRHRRAMMGLFYGAFAINLFFAFIPGRTMWNIFFG